MKTLLFLFIPILSFAQTNEKTACEQKVEVMQEEIYKLATQLEDFINYERMYFIKTKEVETMKEIMRGYIVQIDSLQTLNLEVKRDNSELNKDNQELLKKLAILKTLLNDLGDKLLKEKDEELHLLEQELMKSIKSQEAISLPNRTRLTDFSLDYGELPVGAVIYLKLWVNDAGKVVMVEVIKDKTTIEDQKLIDHLVAQIKKQVRYNVVENSLLQAVFFKIEIE